jgi:hypothetical protein
MTTSPVFLSGMLLKNEPNHRELIICEESKWMNTFYVTVEK